MAMTAVEFLASKGVEIPESTIAHYGVLGMKWGVRKYRSVSPGPAEQKKKKVRVKSAKPNKRAGVTRVPNTFKNKPSNRRMSDAELRSKINRLQMEKQLKDLTAPTPKADKFVKQLLKDSGKQAVRTITSKAITVGIDMAFSKAAGRRPVGSTSKAFLDAMASSGKKGKKE